MSIPVILEGSSKKGKVRAEAFSPKERGSFFIDDEPAGGVVYTIPYREYSTAGAPLTNESGSSEMAIDGSISGTPERAYLDDPTTNWTNTALGGTWDFGSTTHAHNGSITVVDYTALTGATLTINGTNITNTTLTEGVDWTAATSNDATASSLSTAIDGIAGVSSAVSSNFIIVTADTTSAADITTLTSSDGTNLPANATSIDATATVDGSEAELERSSTLDLSSYSALSGLIYIDSINVSRHSILIETRLAGVIVGNEIDLKDYVDTGLLGEWQPFLIPKADLGLNGSIIDQIVITTASTSGAPPNYYIDTINIEETGGELFSLTPGPGVVFEIHSVHFVIMDDIATIDPEAFMGLSALTNGVAIRTQVGGQIFFSTGLKTMFDFLAGGSSIDSVLTGSSESMINFIGGSPGALSRLKGDNGDSFSVQISDDLSSLTSFKSIVRGRILRS